MSSKIQNWTKTFALLPNTLYFVFDVIDGKVLTTGHFYSEHCFKVHMTFPLSRHFQDADAVLFPAEKICQKYMINLFFILYLVVMLNLISLIKREDVMYACSVP